MGALPSGECGMINCLRVGRKFFYRGNGTLIMGRHCLAVLTAVVFWGASFIVTAIAYRTIAPLQLGLVRSALAALLFAGCRAVTGGRGRPANKDLPAIALSGFFGVTLYFSFQNLGLDMTSSSHAALIVASYPAITVLMECAARRRMPPLRQVVGILVAIAGVALLTGAAVSRGPREALGNWLLISTGIAWGFYNLITQKVAGRYPASMLTAWQMLFGALFFVPFAAFEGRPWIMPTVSSGAAILFLGVCCSLLSYLFYNYSLTGLSASAAAALLNLVPVVGIVCSCLVLHEAVSARQILGGLVIVAGVWLSSAAAKSTG